MPPRVRNDAPRRKMTVGDYKRAASGLSKYIFWLIVVVVFEVGSVVLAVLAPQTLGELTNEIYHTVEAWALGQERSMNFDFITRNGIILVFMYVGNAGLQFCTALIMTTISQHYAKKLRGDIESKINRLPLSYFDSHLVGDILSRITNDVDTLAEALSNSIASFVHATALLIGVTIAMFVTCWQMALAVVATLPVLAILTLGDMRLAGPQFKKRRKLLGDLSGIAEENYSGQNVIQLFQAEERTIADFDAANKKMADAMYVSEIIIGFLQPISNFIAYAARAVTMLVGGILMVNNQGVTYGTITAFLVYANLFQNPLSTISQCLTNLQSGSAASARISDFLKEDEEVQDSHKPNLIEGEVVGQVDFEHVDFSYDPSRQIIFDFSAHVEPGSKVAIVGPTGAGKTTMVNLLMRFYETQGGDIKIDGVSTKEMSRREIHDIFGMVLQDTWVFEGTLRENLAYNTPNVTDEQLNEVIKACHLRHYVKTLPGGLDYYFKDTSSISQGEKQLITIARAMVRKAPLLILDEATSNVDTRTEERIQEAMDRLTEGRTSFVIAHRLSTIKNANLILVMDHGNIVEQGTHESLMAKDGFYASLYNSQFSSEAE